MPGMREALPWLCLSFNRRRWRSLDFGSHHVYIEASAPRVECAGHGVLVAQVPWAAHKSDYTHDFEIAVKWLALHATAKDVAKYFRIKWHTVGAIAKRVQKSFEKEETSRFDGLEAIGIEETSYKKGHKYMTVAVNHSTGALIWAHKGHCKAVLTEFFEMLTPEQRRGIRLVPADGARWVTGCVVFFINYIEKSVTLKNV